MSGLRAEFVSRKKFLSLGAHDDKSQWGILVRVENNLISLIYPNYLPYYAFCMPRGGSNKTKAFALLSRGTASTL